MTIENSILWDATPDEVSIGTGLVIVRSSIVQGGCPVGAMCSGEVFGDPLFVAPGLGDYRLLPGSPAIDAGDNSAVPEDITIDLAGNPRIYGSIVDLGAYEWGIWDVEPLAGLWLEASPDPQVGTSVHSRRP